MTTKTKDMPLNFDRPVTTARTGLREPLRLEKWLLRRLLTALGNPDIAFRLWNGEEISGVRRPRTAEVTVEIKQPHALWGIVANPDLYFGDAYSDGAIEVHGDLLRMIELASVHNPTFLGEEGALGFVIRLLAPAPRVNSLKGSRQNIHHHYDLGNEFYRLWLDVDYAQYTCAYFPRPSMTLEQAQVAKMEHICRKLRLKPGDTVVEAGCGWGGLARYMAAHHGAIVKSYNISREQVRFAVAKAREAGLADRVTYVQDDYRNITGDYDVFVSVGMLEHVGAKNYGLLGSVIDQCLKQDGRALIHSIGRNAPREMNRWIEKRIFPGAYPPALSEMMNIFEPFDFSVSDIENLRLHYAETLRHWLRRFEQHSGRVHEMFDERFVRAWRLYLMGSIAAFKLGDLQLFQIVFGRGQHNDLPWSRAHIYADD